MNNPPVLLTLLTPSLSSSIVCFASTAVVLGATSWSYISQNLLFYDYLFGKYGLATMLLLIQDSFSWLKTILLGSSATYYVLVAAFACIIGLAVYVVLEELSEVGAEVGSVIHIAHEHTPAGKSSLRVALALVAVRSLSIIGWVLYWMLFINITVPLAAGLQQTGIQKIALSAVDGWLYIAWAAGLFIVSVHIHIIFVRLCAFRPRLLGPHVIAIAVTEKRL